MASRRKIAEACIRSRLIYGTQQAWLPSRRQIVSSLRPAAWAAQCLRGMVKGVWRQKASDEKDAEFLFNYSSEDILRIQKTVAMRDIITVQYLKWIAHVRA